MAEWKLTESDIEKILNTPALKLPETEQHKRDVEVARAILRERKNVNESN